MTNSPLKSQGELTPNGVAFLTATAVIMVMLVLFALALVSSKTQPSLEEIEAEKVALIAEELNIKTDNIILSDGNSRDFDIVYTEKYDYRVNFTETKDGKLKIANLIPIK